jgi:hydrogenase nickel incorporation protein HypA/HybF
MHELSLCQNLVDILQQQALAHDARRVTGVWLELGSHACVEESALRFSFEIACQGTRAEGCLLHITVRPSSAWCWGCNQSVELTPQSECPHCHCSSLQREINNEMLVKSIEIQQE